MAVNAEASRVLLVPVLESQGLPAHALPWRKGPLPGGGLGIMVNIIDTPIRQLSLFPSAKQSQGRYTLKRHKPLFEKESFIIDVVTLRGQR